MIFLMRCCRVSLDCANKGRPEKAALTASKPRKKLPTRLLFFMQCLPPEKFLLPARCPYFRETVFASSSKTADMFLVAEVDASCSNLKFKIGYFRQSP